MAPTDKTISDMQAKFTAEIDIIEKGIKRVIDEYQKLVDALRKQVEQQNAVVMLFVAQTLKKVRAAVEKLVTLCQGILEHATPVVSLFVIAFEWLDKVKGPVSDLSSQTTRYADPDLAYWSGAAASMYGTAAQGQQNAVNAATARADFVSGWLANIAQTNLDFALGIGDIVAQVIGELVSAIIDAASLVDSPWALDILAKTAGGFVQDAYSLAAKEAKQFSNMVEDLRKMLSSTDDHTYLPDGNWPVAIKS